ncbi:MAG: flagellar biosynthesis protein FlhB, partial [Desulfatitalea sp.]|nr:flagellar biosynthesis protein FlhB [Desulfatitalea sp.]
ARKKGQVAKSREIPSVLVLLSALSVFYFVGDWMFDQMNGITRDVFLQIGYWRLNAESAHALMWHLFQKMVTLMAPLVIGVALAGIIGNIAQVGFMLTGESMSPKFSKLNPIEGLKRLFSTTSLTELVKSIFKVVIIGSIGYNSLRGGMEQIPALVAFDTASIMGFMGRVALKLGYYTCLALIVLAALDYVFQHWKHERDLRMSKQEIKDEYKQREGDPLIRSRIRSAQREMAMRRMMEAVPKATVIITNPTHLAIAIKYERGLPAPIIVAKGAGHIAERIREIAGQHDIPIIEQKPLARALYKDVEIGQYVPVDLYHAVAEVLAYVYRLKGLVHAS